MVRILDQLNLEQAENVLTQSGVLLITSRIDGSISAALLPPQDSKTCGALHGFLIEAKDLEELSQHLKTAGLDSDGVGRALNHCRLQQRRSTLRSRISASQLIQRTTSI